MPRYIDANRLKQGIKLLCEDERNPLNITAIAYFALLELVDTMPTADVEPVRHGRWIRGVSKGWPTNPSCLWYCSCCGEKIRYIDTLRTYQKSKKPVNEVNPRCRKCGAKMDKKEDKNENN